MASLEKRNGIFRVVFRFAGQRTSRSLKTRNENAAAASLARLEDNLRRVELGTLEIPADADPAAFLLSDGKRTQKPKPQAVVTLSQLIESYLAGVPDGAIEQSTLDGIRIHARHLLRILGTRFRIELMNLTHLQGYVQSRRKERGLRGKNISPRTIKKELATLTSIWRWAQRTGVVSQPLPKDGLRYPKTDEKPPFQTWAEIERKVSRGGLSEAEEAELWDSLFLTTSEISDLLGYVRDAARHDFIYPMFVFAAHTGARRSELLRSEVDDIDLEDHTVLVRERKRVHSEITTRRVPTSPLLADVLRRWLFNHPGGKHTFSLHDRIARSRSRCAGVSPLTRHQANDHFKRTLSGSKWEKLRGWHVFRHSFCSNSAAAGIDQRIINAWVGHQTEEMVRRYRHLIPNQEQAAIRLVFAE